MTDVVVTLHTSRQYSKGLRDAMLAVELHGIFRCPVCYHLMPYPPNGYNICPVCDKEFGSDAKPVKNPKRLWP